MAKEGFLFVCLFVYFIFSISGFLVPSLSWYNHHGGEVKHQKAESGECLTLYVVQNACGGREWCDPPSVGRASNLFKVVEAFIPGPLKGPLF